MVISKTPFRISFFGGGTDIPKFFNEEGGQVLSISIDKYCYVTARHLPPFFDHSIRLAYSKLEMVKEANEIEHPLVRVALQEFKLNNIEIHYDADLPGNSGLGSSSSFGVGLANCLSALNGRLITRRDLASIVINWERNILREAGGYQDQIAASYGGMNQIIFSSSNNFSIRPIPISEQLCVEMQSRMILCYIPKFRFSSAISVAREIDEKSVRQNLRFIRDSVDIALNLLQKNDFDSFGELLDETWKRKREFNGVSDSEINQIYSRAVNSGALGGKLLGAGGGGFMLLWCKSDNREQVIRALSPLLVVPFNFDFTGSQIIYISETK